MKKVLLRTISLITFAAVLLSTLSASSKNVSYKGLFREEKAPKDATFSKPHLINPSSIPTARLINMFGKKERANAFSFSNYTVQNLSSPAIASFIAPTSADDAPIQHFIVPVGVTEITVTSYGAAGGNVGSINGGRGAVLKRKYTVSAGDEILMVVGQKGLDSDPGQDIGAGGGGGTFVYKMVSGLPSLLIASGGGGGAGSNTAWDQSSDPIDQSIDANIGNSSISIEWGFYGLQNEFGGGGYGEPGTDGGWGNNSNSIFGGISAGGGSGWNSYVLSGDADNDRIHGKSPQNNVGSLGGNNDLNQGFGGYGGGGATLSAGGGGGGGYSGGGGGSLNFDELIFFSDFSNHGGGGGSYVGNAASINGWEDKYGNHDEDGKVIIEWDQPVTCTTPSITGPISVCVNGTITLTGNGTPASSNAWASSNPAVATINNSGVVTGVAEGTATITYTNDGGCSQTTTITVSANTTPTFTQVRAICSGGTLYALPTTSTNGINGTWSPALNNEATTTYTFTPDAGQCATTATMTITVNPLPTATIIADGSTTVCEPGSVVLHATQGTGYTYQWFNSGNPINGAIEADYTATTSGDYTVNVMSAAGCTSTSAITTVTISLLPQVSITFDGPTTTVCPNNTVTLHAVNIETGYSFQWLKNGVPIPGASSANYIATETGNYGVQVTNSNNCSSPPLLQIAVLIEDITPPVVPTLAAITNECSATATAPTTTDDCAGTITGTTTDPLTYNTQGDHIIHWTFTDPSGNHSTADQHVIIADVTPPTVNCPGNISTTANTVVAGQSGAMVSFSATASDNCGTPTITYSQNPGTFFPVGTTTVTVTADDGHGHTASCTFDVTVTCSVATPTIYASGGTTFCPGGSVMLTSSSATGNVWSTGATTQSITVSTTGTYSVTVNNGSCSAVSAGTSVTVQDITAPVTPTLANITSECSATAPVATTTDACAGTITGTTSDPLTYNTQGDHVIHWTFTDPSGNSTTADQHVIITDVTSPTIVCPGNISTTANTVVAGQSGAMVSFSATASDNCGTPTITYSQNPGTFFPVGTTTVTVTADDGHGHTATCTFDVTVTCSVATPTIYASGGTTFCPGGSVMLTSSSATGNVWSTGATTQSITVSTTGTYSVTVNNGSCSATSGAVAVTVQDITAPVAPTLATINAECSATAPVATTTDACAGTITGTTSDPLTYTTQGDHVIHWTFTDPSGNSTTADQHIIITDVTPPTVICPGNISTTANTVVAGQSGAMVSFSATASDNCGTPTITYSQNPGTFFPVGTTTVTVTADDGHGHTASCTFDVTVTCAIATPTISAGGPTSFCPGGSVILTSSSATGNVWSTGATTQSITVSATGTYSVTINNGSCSAVSAGTSVTVQDITAPVTPTLANITGECSATAPVATTTDACAGTITGTTSDPLTYTTQGDHVIHWTFTDPSGNSTTADQHVIIKDVTAPIVACPNNITVTANTLVAGQSGAMVSFTATGSDNCGTPAISYSQNPGTFFPTGTTTVTVTADDGHGNTSTCHFDVIVNCALPVFLTHPSDISQSTDPGVCGAVVEYVSQASGDPSIAIAYTFSGATTGSGSGTGTGSLFNTGTTNVVVTASNICGSVSSSFTVTVNDIEKPVITGTPSTINKNNDAGNCGASVTWTEPTAKDNCGVISFTSDHHSGDVFPIGSTTVTYTATDAAGNSRSSSFDVVVTDNELPTVTCPSGVSVTANTTESSVNGVHVTYGTATASDNCGVASITYSTPSGGFFPVGDNVVDVTVTDIHGNVTHCSFHVVVNCVTPVFTTCPEDISKPTDAGICGAVVNYVSAAVGDPATTYSYTFSGATTGSGAGTGSGATFNTGVTTVTVIASNICGSATCRFTITVNDTEKPVITGTPTTINKVNDAGNCGASVTWTEPIAKDNCGVISFTSDHHSGDVFPVGTTTVTYTAKDAAGNTTNTHFDVVVTDNELPTVICPSGVSVTANTTESSVNGAHVTYGTATASDNCGVASITYSKPSGGFFPVGDNVVDVTVTDIHGNVSHCSFHVVVNCVTPVFTTCPEDISKPTDAGICGAVVNYVSAAVGDPATTYSYTFSGATTGSGAGTGSGATFNTGVTTVTITASNLCGSATCRFTITVNDTEKPVITGTPTTINKVNDAGNCGASVTWTEPIAKDNCGVISFTSDHHSSDVFPVGTTTVTYTAKDAAGNTTTTHFDVVVTDNENPVITVPADVTHTADPGLCSFTFGSGNQTMAAPGGNGSVNSYDGLAFVYATATDNCGVTVTGVRDDGQPLDAAYPVGVTTITWTATDIHNNTVSGTQKITVTDDENPVIVGLPNSITKSNDAGQCGAVVNWTAATATDNCPGVTIVSDHQSGEVFPIGSTLVTYTATDAHGHSVTAGFTVTVNDTQKPAVTAPGTYGVVSEPGKCGATIASIGHPLVSDNCGIASITNDHPSAFYPVGTTTVTWIVTDIHGNVTDTAKQLITVIDNEKPTITAPASITVNNDPGYCGAVVSIGVATANDNCGVFSVTNDHPSNYYPVGTTIVTWTVLDVHGYKTKATQSITVIDNESPVITVPSDITHTADAGLCSFTFDAGSAIQTAPGGNGAGIIHNGVSLGVATAIDNCAVTVTGVRDDGQPLDAAYPVGVTTITWTATDPHGHAVSGTQKVTITDDENPVIVNLPGNITKGNDLNTCGAVVNWTAATATDNCPGVTIVSDHHSGDVFPLGTTLVTYTATDAHGHSVTGNFSVTVSDVQKPVVQCPADITVNASTTNNGQPGANVTFAATASDNCGVPVISYSVPSGSFFPVGTTTVTTTVDDGHGNTASCTFNVTVNCVPPVITVSSVPTSNTFTGGVPTSLYLGYGAQSTVLQTAVAGSGTYSYAWSGTGASMLNSTSGSAPKFTPTEAGSYQFTVVATNGVGCKSSTSISICVTDIRVPGNTSSEDDGDEDHASCDHHAHSAKDCPHKYEKDSKCDHKSHSDKDCPYKKKDDKYGDKDDHGKYDDKKYQDNSKNYGYKSSTKENDDNKDGKDDHHVTCDHKAHSAKDCPHKDEKDNKCDHKSHSEKDCPYKDKDDHHVTCDHHAHSAKDCPHKDEKDNKCDHKSHSEKDCPYKDKDDHDEHHDGDGEHGQDNYKVFICHVPPGNPGQHLTLSISINAVADHLANHPGDRLGSCEQAPCTGYYDWEKPVISCPPSVTVDYGSSMVPTVTGKAKATDNSGVVTVTYTDSNNQGDDVHAANYYNYTITRTWKATDPSGNSSECSQLITVRDQVKPVITCPGNVTLTCAGDITPAAAGTATATDNSNGPVTITYSDKNGGDGIYRTWTATDASGNYASCTQKITVRDDVKPVITAPADVTVQCGTSTAPSATGTAVATDNCSSVTVTYSDYTKYNVITRTWKATDASGNYSTDAQKITIVDNVKPVITAPADKSISCGASTEPKYCGGYATGTDGCSDVTISYSDVTVGNVIVRTWKATDASGNYSTAVQNITIIDNVKPVITDPKDYTISCGASTEPKNCGGSATATDNCSNPVITYSDVINDNVITRTWKATDAAGNYSTSVQKITIVDNTKPVITDVKDVTISCAGSVDPSITGMATATDNCSDVTITYSDNVSGNYITRTWKATDAAGNYSTSTQKIIVNDNVKPVITSPADKVVGCGGSTDPVATGYATATDNCSNPVVTYTDQLAANGVITRTWKATDAAGNYSTSVQMITKPTGNPCALPYPYVDVNNPRTSITFNEGEVLRAIEPGINFVCGTTPSQIKVWYNDEHALTLGVRQVIVKTKTGTTTTNYPVSAYSGVASTVVNPALGTMFDNNSDQSGNDIADAGGRPLRPVLYVSDITNDPNNRAGDWQHNGTPFSPDKVSGSWKAAVRTVDKTKYPAVITVTPDADPKTKNNWSMGSGGDVVPAGLENEGYGAEIVWNIASLNLLPGHTYRIQVIVHDGDQNKVGGDAGQACTVISIPTNTVVTAVESKKVTATTEASAQVQTEEDLKVTVMPNPSTTYFTLKMESKHKEVINLRVFDANGRVVDAKPKIAPNSTIQIGQGYSSGTYYAEMIQGTRRKVVQLIKGRG